jgi:hypothetical protein
MRKFLFAIVLSAALLMAQASFAASAICRITGVTTTAAGRIQMRYMVSVTDAAVDDFNSVVIVDFTASQNQFLTKIKNKVVDDILNLPNGPLLAPTDIWVFGGPQ